VPVCETHDEVLANCEKIADTIKGVKMGYPGERRRSNPDRQFG